MTDFRAIERELIDALEADGVDVVRNNGDATVTLIPLPECGNPDRCELATTRQGKLYCPLCEVPAGALSRCTSISITKLAKRLADR